MKLKKLVIENPNNGRKLKSIHINNQLQTSYFITHQLFLNVGKIELETQK